MAKPKPVASRPEPAVLPESALRRTRFVPPEYPVRALERRIEGWVDIEFTVAADGTTCFSGIYPRVADDGDRSAYH